MIHVIDAHAIIWYLERDPKLSRTAAAILDDPTSRLIVPTIVLAESWR